MSIEETNRVRAQLGLKPLNVGSGQTKSDKQDEDERDDLEGSAIPNSEVRHKPAENLTEKSHIEKMREKLQQRRQKRLVEAKLLNVKTLGESDADDVSSVSISVSIFVRSCFLSSFKASIIKNWKILFVQSFVWSSLNCLMKKVKTQFYKIVLPPEYSTIYSNINSYHEI